MVECVCVFQLPSSPAVHIVDMKDTRKSTLSVARKRKLHCDSPLMPVCPLRSKSSPLSQASDDDVKDIENIPMFRLSAHSAALVAGKQSKGAAAHSPVYVTPDRRFEKPTAFISPITRSMTKVPKNIKVENTKDSLVEFCDFIM